MTMLKPLSYLVDDIPHDDVLYTDLKFFEKHFHGLMPFEILVETGEPNGALDQTNLEIAEQIQQVVMEDSSFARPVSLVEVMKACRQAYRGGDPSEYSLFSGMERNFILPIMYRSMRGGGPGGKIASAFTDSTRSIIRLSFKMADVGTTKMKEIVGKVRPKIDSIIKDTNVKVTVTGSSVVFLKGNQYLIDSLNSSIWQSYILIALVMLPLFRSFRLLIISLIPNTLPMLWVAGFMGFSGIPLKPSTVLVFSIALGIAVDCTTHFLVKYRQEIERHDWDIRTTVLVALKETGSGMIYTSIIIFFGFAIFGASQFEGTVALGMLTSTTILVSMLANLILLPALIYSFGSIKKIRRFQWKKKSE
jgi:predicted RND superfamily exporter protein